jgi:transcriptional regulator with XRE-family HTH domain
MALSRLIGSRLRERRQALGLKQADIAARAGISGSFLNLIEHNRRRVGADLLATLAQVLQMDAAALGGLGESGLLDDLRSAGAGTAAELERVEEFVGRFPGWAGALAQAAGRAAQAERAVMVLNDRMAHDPHLAQALHELLTAVSAVRATAGILAETGDLAPEWRDRFQRNLHQDAERMAIGAETLVAWLNRAEGGAEAVASPQEEFDAWLEAKGWHLAGLETGEGAEAEIEAGLASHLARDLARAWVRQTTTDARAMPLAEAQGFDDPLALARAFDVGPIAAFRRMAGLPGAEHGLVICDAAGALTFRKPVRGFALPRFGAACALWPLFQALNRPGQPVEARVRLAGRAGEGGFHLRAVAEMRPGAHFNAPVLVEAAMLITPLPQRPDNALEIGSTCAICAKAECPARREGSILTGA